MKTQRILASIATLSIIVSGVLASVSAMYDENAKNENKWGNTNEVRIMTTSVGMWSGSMSGSGMNNASWTGVMKSEQGRNRAIEAKNKSLKAKEKFGEKAEKAEKVMNKFMEKFERKTKQEKLNQYKALGTKIDRTIEKFVNLDISEEKKEAYRNLFEYIRALNEEKIVALEEGEEETGTWSEVE